MTLIKNIIDSNNIIIELIGILKIIEIMIPIVIEMILIHIENTTICSGEVENFCAIAGGIIRIAVINKAPINVVDIPIKKAVNIINIKRILKILIPLTWASSTLIIINNIDFQKNNIIEQIINVIIKIILISIVVNCNILPNKYLVKSDFSSFEIKCKIIIPIDKELYVVIPKIVSRDKFDICSI